MRKHETIERSKQEFKNAPFGGITLSLGHPNKSFLLEVKSEVICFGLTPLPQGGKSSYKEPEPCSDWGKGTRNRNHGGAKYLKMMFLKYFKK